MAGTYLTESLLKHESHIADVNSPTNVNSPTKVMLQMSTPPQIRQLILYYYLYTKSVGQSEDLQRVWRALSKAGMVIEKTRAPYHISACATMYSLLRFRKSTPPQNRQIIVDYY